MPRKFFHTALFCSVAAMLAMLATTAHSTAIIRARLDPNAVAGIPVPGYDGYADFESALTPACLGTGWRPVNSTSGSCGSVSMYDSVIYLYGDAPGEGPGNSAHRDTMQFESQLPITILALGDPDAIFGIYVVGGEIQGIDMNPVAPYVGTDGGYAGRSFRLAFGTNCGGVAACPDFDPFVSLADARFPDNGLRGEFTVIANDLDETPPRGSVFPDPTTVAVIPEPGTMSLLLGALGGAWLTRRRSKLTQ